MTSQNRDLVCRADAVGCAEPGLQWLPQCPRPQKGVWTLADVFSCSRSDGGLGRKDAGRGLSGGAEWGRGEAVVTEVASALRRFVMCVPGLS